MAEEIWKPVVGYEGLYIVSNYGRVYSLRSKKILKPRKLPHGYLRVNLPAKDGQRDAYIHRVVAEAFCEKPNGCDVVNHIDNDTTNNHASNLEWTTQRGNVRHSMNQGRMINFPNAIQVIGKKDGNTYHFDSAKEASEKTGCDHSGIIKCCKHKKKQINGYRWEYAEVI